MRGSRRRTRSLPIRSRDRSYASDSSRLGEGHVQLRDATLVERPRHVPRIEATYFEHRFRSPRARAPPNRTSAGGRTVAPHRAMDATHGSLGAGGDHCRINPLCVGTRAMRAGALTDTPRSTSRGPGRIDASVRSAAPRSSHAALDPASVPRHALHDQAQPRGRTSAPDLAPGGVREARTSARSLPNRSTECRHASAPIPRSHGRHADSVSRSTRFRAPVRACARLVGRATCVRSTRHHTSVAVRARAGRGSSNSHCIGVAARGPVPAESPRGNARSSRMHAGLRSTRAFRCSSRGSSPVGYRPCGVRPRAISFRAVSRRRASTPRCGSFTTRSNRITCTRSSRRETCLRSRAASRDCPYASRER